MNWRLLFNSLLLAIGALLLIMAASLRADTIQITSVYERAPGWPIYTDYALDGHHCDGYENEPGTNCVQWIPKPSTYVQDFYVPVTATPEPGTLGVMALLTALAIVASARRARRSVTGAAGQVRHPEKAQ